MRLSHGKGYEGTEPTDFSFKQNSLECHQTIHQLHLDMLHTHSGLWGLGFEGVDDVVLDGLSKGVGFRVWGRGFIF